MAVSGSGLPLVVVVTAALAGAAPVLPAQDELVFAPPVSVPLDVPFNPTDVRVIDLTGDGILDLVVVGQTTPAVRQLVGQGPTTFGPPIDTVVAKVVGFDVGDVNGDGRPDLVKVPAALPQNLQTQFGDGLGGFSVGITALDISANDVVSGLRLLDVDEDGDLDAVVQQDGDLNTYLGDGAGNFTDAGLHTPSPFILLKEDLHVLDFDGDGHLDVLGSGNAFFYTGWSVFRGDGRGGLAYWAHGYNSVDGNSVGNAAGDFDGDHRPDVVVNDQDVICACGKLGFGQGTGSGFVEPPQAEPYAPGISRMRAGDLDRDGLDDIVGTSSGVWVLRGHGDFTFDRPQSLLPGLSAADVALVDLDGDGALDVVALHSFKLSILINEAPPSGWTDLGHGLAGSDGVPSLLGQGELQAGEPGALKLTHANPDKLAAFFLAPTGAPTPFKGGMLVPVPPTLVVMLGTSPEGTITLPWNSWPSLPAGTDFFFQFAIVDSAGPAGASLSNAVSATQP